MTHQEKASVDVDVRPLQLSMGDAVEEARQAMGRISKIAAAEALRQSTTPSIYVASAQVINKAAVPDIAEMTLAEKIELPFYANEQPHHG